MSRQCVSKWVRRYREEGQAGLEDRSSRPRCSPMRTSREVEELALQARRTLRLWECDPLTGEPLKPSPGPVVRYERSSPGELLHMDVKKLSSIPPGGGWKIHGRGNAPAEGAGWAFVHSIVDDYTHLAYTEPLPDEKGTTVAAFTARALAAFRQKGVTHITEVMTDNHWRYTRSRAFASLLAQHGIRHITIKPYHPQQNGKVERYNQTLKRERVNSQSWPDNQTRNQALRHWLQRVQRRFSRLAAFVPHHPSGTSSEWLAGRLMAFLLSNVPIAAEGAADSPLPGAPSTPDYRPGRPGGPPRA